MTDKKQSIPGALLKTIFTSLLASIFLFSAVSPTVIFAMPAVEKTDILSYLRKLPPKKYTTEKELFIIMVDVIAEYSEIPASYRSIQLDSKTIYPGTRLYRTYQKAVYMDILKQSDIPLKLSGKIATHKKLVELTNIFFGEKIDGKILVDGTEIQAIKKNLTNDDLLLYGSNYLSTRSANDPVQNAPGFELFSDVYKKLTNEHIDNASFDKRTLLYGAIEGMAKATNDPFTTYFPPAQSQEFSEELNGEFEWIGTYLDMPAPGEFVITAPIPNSPAEKAGILAGDRIMKINDFEVIKTTPISDVVKKIKWPAGTKVTLTLVRWTETKVIEVERQKIKIELVTAKDIDSSTRYIQISSFGRGTTEWFDKAVTDPSTKNALRIILDLRNDGGGDLQEVSNILDYFVPAGKDKFQIRSLYGNEVALSVGSDILKGKKIIILVNKGTASASEILAGTIQDYYGENVKLVGEKTYGKGSVQTLMPYADGSSIKFTSARWFTGKDKRTIDKVGITPDFVVEFDVEAFKKWTDNQLEFAKGVQF